MPPPAKPCRTLKSRSSSRFVAKPQAPQLTPKEVKVTSVDLTGSFETVISTRVTAEISRDSQNLGVMLAFRATLAPGIVLSTLPDDFDPTSHWAHALFPAFDCLAVKKGSTIAIDYSYDRGLTTLRVTEAD